MKILVLNSEYPPVGAGAGNASANIARQLVEAGDEVVVVTAAYGALAREEAIDGVRILRGPASRRRQDRSTAMEQVAFILGASIRCLSLLRDFRPDVVLAFFGLPSGAIAWLLKRLHGIPYIVSLRGGDVPGFRPYDFWLYHRIAVPFLHVIWHAASGVVANSGGLRELAREFDSGVNIAVIPNGVDEATFWNAERKWSDPRILSVGRVVHQKGLDVAVRALAGLRDLNWEWRVAGDGPQLDYLRAMLKREGLQDRVALLGWTDLRALTNEYQTASVFLFPSRHEGMPNALLEAMASGLPAVASRIAGNEELVLPGETGLLGPADDPESLREALRAVLTDPSQRERMGRAARNRAAAKYGWVSTARQYRDMLKRAAA